MRILFYLLVLITFLNGVLAQMGGGMKDKDEDKSEKVRKEFIAARKAEMASTTYKRRTVTVSSAQTAEKHENHDDEKKCE
jgi:hypothetical protein